MSTPELTPPQMNEQNIAPNILITSPAANIDVVEPPTSLTHTYLYTHTQAHILKTQAEPVR